MSARTAKGFGAALAALVLIAATPAEPESRLQQYFRLRGEAGEAAKAGDLATAEARLEAALALYPTSPGSLIRLARVEAAAGKPAEAVAHLATYAELDLTFGVAGDPALKALADRPDFAPVAVRLAKNAQAVGAVEPIAVLEPAGAIFEGIVRHGDGWLVSSVAGRTILTVSPDGAAKPFLTPDAETGGLFGMAVDARKGVLWVAEARGPGIPGSTGAARTGLIQVSLKDGRVLARYLVPADGDRKHQLGDVALGEDGAVYASDSVGATIYRLAPGSLKLEPFVTSREMASPQGMAVCPGADALVVADYSTGLHRIDLRTGSETSLGGKWTVALAGTDGLFITPYSFAVRNAWPHPVAVIATQNGVSPQRVMFLRLSPDCRELEDAFVLAANHAALDDPTLGAPAPGGIVVIGSSGWAGYDGDGKPVAGAPTTAKLLSIPLP